MASLLAKSFESNGFCVIPNVLDAEICDRLIAKLEDHSTHRPGIRSLLVEPWCLEVSEQIQRHTDVSPLLPKSAVAVQCTLFDKSPDKNWLVAWHQDLTIPVRERTNDPNCRGWSIKEGTWHVQPPVEVLSNLVAVRLQLDETHADNGSLKVIPRSHSFGRLDDDAIQRLRLEHWETTCSVPRTGVLVMRPLLLHASSKAREGRRRVLHYLFGPAKLPSGLRWS
ncbi:MAG: phytanoyl-CoA dioxygenase family protein [Pirellulales bacterium]